MRHILTFMTGVLFGTGIVVSGMANPAKVINFFDIAGSWDPSLAFVMGGAVLVAAIGYRMVFRRSGPVFESEFNLPQKPQMDVRLILGAGVFGTGWGIAGFCPGGALPVLGTLDTRVMLFVAAMIVGILVTSMISRSAVSEKKISAR